MIRQVVVTAVFLFFNVYAQHDDHEHHRVTVTVYYESLCPDSIKFFTKQLYPSLQGNLSNYVNLTLLPYGKSKTTNDLNQYEFQCHHGPAECNGNRLQACAIRIIDGGKKTEGLGYNKITTGFINCLMDKVKPDGNNTVFPTQECATINHVPDYKGIENCANHPDGSRYLNDVGVLTAALNPPLTGVPTIVFNKQFKQDDNELAQTNFVQALCKYIHGEKPAECSRSSAHSAVSFNFALLALVGAVLFY
ncbi:GILT domain containing protein [Asbolus verrucosus]|uniref:GILT domain containing protein n=1 Tax=Asbolus verrucosus TaxID=1661398 RepID=A0A482VSR5_ASBVE|nr:GILT domain containing protein [Asbolus verrucosus]